MLRLKVTSMTCNNCIQSVVDAVQSVARSARLDIRPDDGQVAGASDLEQVIPGIADAGYSVQRLAA